MAQYLVENLERLEREWRSENPRWNEKIKELKRWRDQTKARERLSEKNERRKKMDDMDYDRDRCSSEQPWQSSFNLAHPSPEFSFVGHRSSCSGLDLEKHIKDLAWTSIPRWAFDALRRGIAVHHAGMHKSYRTLVERRGFTQSILCLTFFKRFDSLFRQGFVQVVIATGRWILPRVIPRL